MTVKKALLQALLIMGLVFSCYQVASAQLVTTPSEITFNSFTATYHLSRDAGGRSLLTTEEVILADFASNSRLSGIVRSIPKTYQGHNVEVKIIKITDVSGTDINYKTSVDKDGNLVINIGDPSIYLYGSQTFRISYQTKDVVDLNKTANQFILNVNGRGWSQGFGKVSASLYIPRSFSSNLISRPICYLGYLKTTSNDCRLSNQQRRQEILVSAETTRPLRPFEALVLKTTFKTTTFSAKKPFGSTKLAILISLSLFGLMITYLWIRKSRLR